MPDAALLTDLALVATALCLGGILKGATGAGAPIIAVPVMALLFGVEIAVVTFVVPSVLTNIWQGWHFRAHQCPPRFTWGFATAGAMGAVVGSYLLATVPPKVLLLAVAVAVLVYIAFRLARPNWILCQTQANRFVGPAGLVAGMLQGATGISAPVSVTFLNAMQLTRPAFIATISVFFAMMSSVQVVALFWLGLMDGSRLMWGVVAMLPLLVGMPVGAWLAKRFSRQTFDRVILVLLAVISVRLIWQALI